MFFSNKASFHDMTDRAPLFLMAAYFIFWMYHNLLIQFSILKWPRYFQVCVHVCVSAFNNACTAVAGSEERAFKNVTPFKKDKEKPQNK